MADLRFRRHLSMPGLLRTTRTVFGSIKDPTARRGLSLADCLMSGLAVFLLKYPSLLQFDEEARLEPGPAVVGNLRRLYGIRRVPSDTAMRERLDRIDPVALQRGKALERFTVLDGTGYFSSKKVHCERNAAKRLVADFRREHPPLRTIVVQDGLYSTAPHLALLRALDLRFIITARPGDHTALFDHIKDRGDALEQLQVEDAKCSMELRWRNDLPLNAGHGQCRVNFLAGRQTDNKSGKVTVFTWVTDIAITADNVTELMRVGRSRWRVENEVYNTPGNHGYKFEHNFGHGRQHLSALFATLTMPAFLIDQIQA